MSFVDEGETEFRPDTYQEYLNTVYRGHTELWELQDYYNLPTKTAWRSTERLIEEGYLKRKGSKGPDKLVFRLSSHDLPAPDGEEAVDVPEEERELVERYNLSMAMLDVLRAIRDLSERTDKIVSFDIIDEIGLDPNSRLNPLVYRLEQHGYVETGGWVRRYHDVTDKGRVVLDELESGASDESESETVEE